MKIIKFEIPDLTIPSSYDVKVGIKKTSANTGKLKVDIKEKTFGQMLGSNFKPLLKEYKND